MNGLAVVSSVRLTESTQFNSWASVNCLPRRLSIVLRTRTIKFKVGSFHGGYVCARGIVPHVQIDPTRSI